MPIANPLLSTSIIGSAPSSASSSATNFVDGNGQASPSVSKRDARANGQDVNKCVAYVVGGAALFIVLLHFAGFRFVFSTSLGT